MIIGIDNGLSGGLVAISRQHGLIIAKTPMPVITRSLHRPKKTNEIHAAEVVRWIADVTDYRPCLVVIEECPEHANRASTMRSMGISYGILIGAITGGLTGYRVAVVRSGNSLDSWQRAILGKVPQGKTKPAALAVASDLWPDEKWLASPKRKTAHDGMVDAALIAEYARREQI